MALTFTFQSIHFTKARHRSGFDLTWTWIDFDPTRPESIQVYLIWTWDLNWPEYFLTRPDLNEIRSTWFRPETWTDLNLFGPDLNCMKSGRPESDLNRPETWVHFEIIIFIVKMIVLIQSYGVLTEHNYDVRLLSEQKIRLLW